MGKRFHPPSWQHPVSHVASGMVCPHPPYSPGLAPWDFWLFPKVKMTMKGKHFQSIQDIEAATTAQLKTLTKDDFQNWFIKWEERWDNCVRSGEGGGYFGRDYWQCVFYCNNLFYLNSHRIFLSHLVNRHRDRPQYVAVRDMENALWKNEQSVNWF